LIAVPYTPQKLRPETARWAADNNALMRDVSEAPDTYYRALCEWWAETDSVVIVEHDMLPADGVVEEMLHCPEPWCSSPYPLSGMTLGVWLTLDGATSELFNSPHVGVAHCTDALGCTKFSAELSTSLPALVVESGTFNQQDGWVPYVWQFNDARISRLLRLNGLTPHLHAPSAHLSVSPGKE
jgi:hypothetical protein